MDLLHHQNLLVVYKNYAPQPLRAHKLEGRYSKPETFD